MENWNGNNQGEKQKNKVSVTIKTVARNGISFIVFIIVFSIILGGSFMWFTFVYTNTDIRCESKENI